MELITLLKALYSKTLPIYYECRLLITFANSLPNSLDPDQGPTKRLPDLGPNFMSL